MNTAKKQRAVYWTLILICSVAAGITVLSPLPAALANLPPLEIPKPLLVAANFGLIFVVYGSLGRVGIYLAKKNTWPGIYKDGEGVHNLFYRPLVLGVISGLFIIVGSKFFEPFHNLGPLPHPPFPYSIAASFAAGIGEELLMRLVLMSFWAWLLRILCKKWGKPSITDGIAVVIAAVIFGAAHLAGPLYLSGFASISQVPAVFIIELLVLNGLVGILAGREMITYGFVAAVGIHVWADIVWHGIYGSL